MAKLNDADVARLVDALRSGIAPPDGPPRADQSSREPGEAARIREAMAALTHDTSFTRGIEASLQSYLRRSARCRAIENAPAPARALSFESGEAVVLRLDLDADLAAALSDIIIGGEGRDVRQRKRARTGGLLEPLALQILSGIAAAAGIEAPARARFVEATEPAGVLPIGGTIVIGDIEGAWAAAVRVDGPQGAAAIASPDAAVRHAQTAVPAPSHVVPREIVHAIPEPSSKPPDARHAQSQPARDRVLSARPPTDPDGAFSGAVEAACAQLGEITHCAAAVKSVDVSRVEAPALASDHLKLALIAGGQGSLILSLDRDAIAGVASAAVGADLPPSGEPGPVVIDAVEAVLRAALRGFAEKLPGIAGSPQRFVRLAEGALPARSPHYAVAAPLSIGTRLATMHWLVPVWMVSTGDARVPADER